jgi:hypothetical protein
MSMRLFCVLSGVSGLVGVLLLGASFGIVNGPPPNATSAEMINFAQKHFASTLWGAWLQAVGPVLIVLFAFSLVILAGATQHLAGWMTMFGATALMTVSLAEITFYICALFPDPVMPLISISAIDAIQHLYFIVAAPARYSPCPLANTSTIVRIPCPDTGRGFCCAGRYFSPQADTACVRHCICRNPGALVVRCRCCPHRSKWRIGKAGQCTAAGRVTLKTISLPGMPAPERI